MRLDDVVDEDVLLIKIDVEGFEHKVLDGARRLLCNRVVQHIEFEFTTSRIDSACPAEQLLCWFTTVGYLSIYLSIHPSIYLFYLSIHPSIHPSIHSSIHLSIYLSIHPSIHPYS